MSKLSDALAKLAGILKGVQSVLDKPLPAYMGNRPIANFAIDEVGHYFDQYPRQLNVLREEMPTLYGDFPMMDVAPSVAMTNPPNRFSREQLERLHRDITQLFEIRANSEHTSAAVQRPARRVFISHGRSGAWREVQAYIEKDLKLDTLELAQEPNLGRTIPEKLRDAAARCDSAVIVMTAEDVAAEGETRARENVIHEIGYFQGAYGFGRVCLLHEEGTNIPTNMQGLVYSPFPNGTVSACFGLLTRELNAMYR